MQLPAAWVLVLTLGSPTSSLQLRSGNVIEYNGRLLQVLAFDKKAMGRQLGNVQLELRDIVTKVRSSRWLPRPALPGSRRGPRGAGETVWAAS